MQDYDWSDWTTDWIPLQRLDNNLASVPASPGAYIVATDRPVNRAIGTDLDGFLHIGESKNLRDRLWGFIECVKDRRAEWHRAGWRFAFFRFERFFPVASLRVRWVATESKEKAYKVEGDFLLAYLVRHCELPPLNYKFNWKTFEEIGWNVFDDPTPDA